MFLCVFKGLNLLLILNLFRFLFSIMFCGFFLVFFFLWLSNLPNKRVFDLVEHGETVVFSSRFRVVPSQCVEHRRRRTRKKQKKMEKKNGNNNKKEEE